MNKMKITIFSIASSLIIAGCGNNAIVDINACKKAGNFCYKGVNYGKSRGEDFEIGIKDGCATGEGTFTKNYSLSSTSKNYSDGWILGRSKCKQILPNEGTKREEYNSRLRAEHQINQLRLKSSTPTRTIEEKVDTLLDGTQEPKVAEVEY